jgi:hypothetical protein
MRGQMGGKMTTRDEIAGHAVVRDAQGRLEPWTDWREALALEMNFYRTCPTDHGYPRFVCETFLDADWNPNQLRSDIIPATQNGTGILSYLKYYDLTGRQDDWLLETAMRMGDYLVGETLTPDEGAYPRFTRSTGLRQQFPLAADCGSQSDRPYEIEPDKGGIAGYALTLLYGALAAARKDGRGVGRAYLDQALQNARVLAATQQPGDAFHSPWPFRVDYRTGEARGPVSGNMSFILRLYEALIALEFREFRRPRDLLWSWISEYQIASAASDGALFAQFFEDHDTPTNRSAWAPLNLARYLLERRALISPSWLDDAGSLIEFTRRNFTHREFATTVCHEQDEDGQAWGGVNSTYGAVLAMYAAATASSGVADEARRALNFTLYSIDAKGRPRDVHTNPAAGGWQEDAHTDVVHNYVDALAASV